jgi:phospholipid/cholesterol/gamma-HCH transport system substrate-binding protein
MKFMKNKLTNLKVGITVFISLIILLIFISVVGTENNVLTSTYNLKLFLPTVDGLAEGSMVTLGGLKAGSVKKLEFANINGVNGLIATVSVKNSLSSMITEKSTASIKSLGMLGDKYVDIEIGQLTEKPLKDGDFMKVSNSFSIEGAVNGMQGKLDSVFAEMKNAVKEYKGVAEKINNGDGTVGKLISSPELYNSTMKIVSKIDNITTAISQQSGTAGQLIYNKTLYDNLNNIAVNMKYIIDSVTAGKGTAGKFLKDDKLYNNLESISNRLDSLTLKINGNSSVGSLVNSDELYLQVLSLVKEFNSVLTEFKSNPKKFINLSVF